MERIRDNVWIDASQVTLAEVDDTGRLILDGTFVVDPEYLKPVCLALSINYEVMYNIIKEYMDAD